MSCEVGCANCSKETRAKAFNEFKESYQALTSFSYNYNTYSRPTTMLLGVTNRCNLACPYCFTSPNDLDMTIDVAEAAIKWLVGNCQIKDIQPSVNFFGGEPLLMFDEIIKPIVEKYSPEIAFGITTNGVLLDEDKVDFFNKYNVNVLLSFDGVKEVQDNQRSQSYDKVLNNIPYLLLRLPETVMRSTLTKTSIPYIYDSVLMAEELGFQKITFCPNAFEDWDKETEEILYRQWMKVGNHIYNNLAFNQESIFVDPLNKFYSDVNLALKDELKFNNDLLRCGLGTTTCAITPTGDIVPCQEKITCPTIVLGNVITGIDKETHKNFLVNYFNKINSITCNKGCDDKAKLVCLSDICPSRMEDLNYNFSTASCAYYRTAVKVANRLHFLCSNSPKNYIQEYFQEGSYD